MSKVWSEEEVALLKLHYPELGGCVELQALFPHRSLTGVKVKANKLGLRVKNNIRKRRTEEEYRELIKDRNFIPLELYRGSTVPILHKCKSCTHEWLARPQHMLTPGAKCPKCSHADRLNSVEQVDATLSASGIIRHSKYLGSFKPIDLEHKQCGHKWTTIYSYIQQGSGCPLCSKTNTYWGDSDTDIVQLYLLKIDIGTEEFLKIGVTSQLISRRMNKLRHVLGISDSIINLLHSVKYNKTTAVSLEHKILTKSIKHISKLRFEGYTELLSLDNNIESIKQIMDTNE